MVGRSKLYGRDTDLDRLLDLSSTSRIVTVTGAGGIGKTRLVDEARPRLRDRAGDHVYVAHLADLEADADVSVLSALLGFTSPEALAVSVGDEHAIVVLDNCEHVRASTAELTTRLLTASEGVHVVATSREPIGVPDEQLLVLDPLVAAGHRRPRSTGLPGRGLVPRSRRRGGATWERTDDMVAAVTELCRRVDGLPLAIELAASRARAMSPVELLALLDERLDVLRTRDAGRPERHRSVRAAIDVSVDLLDEPGRSFFHRLGALAGTFDLDLAHAVAAPDPDDRLLTVDLVTELIDRSLVVPEATGTRTRYRLLELVRDHARDALRAEGRWNDANERLTEVLASEADAILRDGVTSWSAELISRVIENVGNLSTALDWCIAHDARPHRAVRLFLPLFAAAHQSRSAEVRALGDRILERWPSDPAPLRAEALAVLATAYAVGGQPQRCSELAHEALADAGLTAIGEVVAHRALTIAAIGAGDVEGALEHATTGRGVARAAGLHPFERELAGFEASLLDRDGHPDEADALAHEAAAASVAAGDQITEIWARLVIATVAMRSGRFDAARASIDQAQATSHAIQGVWWGGAIFRSQALLASYEAAAVGSDDGWEASRELWRRAIQQAARRGDLPELALTLKLAAVVAARADHLTTAHALLDAVPPTPEVTVLPELFEEERVELESARPAGGPGARPSLVVALRHALSRGRHARHGRARRRRACARARSSRPQLAREGAVWAVRWDGSTVRVRDMKGVARPRGAPRRPRQEVHALELMGGPDVGGGAGPGPRRARPA